MLCVCVCVCAVQQTNSAAGGVVVPRMQGPCALLLRATKAVGKGGRKGKDALIYRELQQPAPRLLLQPNQHPAAAEFLLLLPRPAQPRGSLVLPSCCCWKGVEPGGATGWTASAASREETRSNQMLLQPRAREQEGSRMLPLLLLEDLTRRGHGCSLVLPREKERTRMVLFWGSVNSKREKKINIK